MSEIKNIPTENKPSKIKKVFIEGAITPEFIANAIAKHSAKTNIGAHDIFLGQVRADKINDKTVAAIEYTSYHETAEQEFHNIREEAFRKYDLTCMHIYHSLGKVKAGEICLFVFVSSKHRNDAFTACREIVEKIKSNVPIWGKEIFEDHSHQWKTNTDLKVSYQNSILDDLDKIKELANKFKLDTEDLSHKDFITAKLNGELIGFGRLKHHTDFDEISTIGVVGSYRKNGIGKKIVSQLMNQTSKKIYLATVIPLFFQKLGFFNTNEIPFQLETKIEQCHSKCHSEKVFILTK